MVVAEARETGSITTYLQQWRAGESEALDSLLPCIYGELHQLAARHLRKERAAHTLQPTALVNEVFLRLAGNRPLDLDCRRHFYGIASRLMRQILIDHARRQLT